MSVVSGGASRTLARFLKVLLVFCCVYVVYGFLFDPAATDVVYSTNATFAPGRTSPPVPSKPPPERGRPCFVDAPAEGGPTTESGASTPGTDDATAASEAASTGRPAPADNRTGVTSGPSETGCGTPCPAVPPGLAGPLEVNLTAVSLADLERTPGDVSPGGRYAPRVCRPKDRVAIVIPYRDREAHLAVFLNNMHPFLMRQQIDYGIFVVEQKGDGKFNRASLMNVGFVEANRLRPWDCFVFHDVDLLPLDDRNLYTCPTQPRHLSAAVDKFDFKLPYATIFGGVSALTAEQFRRVNGFSNAFWGWGGEDDDMANRINHRGYHISRYPMSVARYTMLDHEKESPNPRRYDLLTKGKRLYETEGLNSLRYEVAETRTRPLHTLFLVELRPPS